MAVTPNLGLELFEPLGVGWREDATAGALLDFNMMLIDAALGYAGSSVSVNSASVANPNFVNSATVTFSVTGSSVSATATVVGGVSSVNTKTGTVVLSYSDVGADVAGAAATAQSNAEAYANGLASNYDIAGAAATAQSNAEASASSLYIPLSVLSAHGDIIYEDASLGPISLPIGSTGYLMTVAGGQPAWEAVPTWNQSTTGTASNLSGTPALPNGTTATTQTAGDNSTKLATTAYVATAVGAYIPLSVLAAHGDIIYENASLGPVNLPIGTPGQHLTVVGGQPAWSTVVLAATDAGSAHHFLTSYTSSSGAFTDAQPSAADLSDSASSAGYVLRANGTSFVSAQLGYGDLSGAPTLAATTSRTANSFFSSYSATTGAFGQSQPAVANLSDTPNANTVLAGPTSGSAATATFRGLVSADIPANAANTSGSSGSCTGNAATANALASGHAITNAQDGRGLFNFSTVTQNTGQLVAATPVYITKSDIDLPSSLVTGVVAGTVLKYRFNVGKNADGTGACSILLYYGTNGSTSDSAYATLTLPASTAAVDTMTVDIQVTFSSATACNVVMGVTHSAATAAGFGVTSGVPAYYATPSGMSIPTSCKFGVGIQAASGGTMPTYIIGFVQAEAFNLV